MRSFIMRIGKNYVTNFMSNVVFVPKYIYIYTLVLPLTNKNNLTESST